MLTELEIKREEFATKQAAIKALWDESGDNNDMALVKSLDGDSASKVNQFQVLNRELEAIGDELKGLDELFGLRAQSDARQRLLTEPGAGGGMRHPEPGGPEGLPALKTLGRLFIESKTHFPNGKGFKNAPEETFDIDLKTVFRTGAGWTPEEVRLPRVELDPQRPLAIAEQVPNLPTMQDVIRYMLETTFTNNAVETAESTATTDSDLIGEAALVLQEQTVTVEWLPVFLPVTMQQLEDVAGVEAYINQRLAFMIQQRLDSQIIVGDGVTPNILGTNNVASINVQAKGADSTIDAIYKGMDLVRTVGFAEPSHVFIHPTDWQDIRLATTADGIYLWGSPMDAGPLRIWGVPVTASTAVTLNTATLGDYRNFSALYTKRGVTLSATDSHQSYFTRGMLAIKADMRIAMVHFRAPAFTTVTGI